MTSFPALLVSPHILITDIDNQNAAALAFALLGRTVCQPYVSGVDALYATHDQLVQAIRTQEQASDAVFVQLPAMTALWGGRVGTPPVNLMSVLVCESLATAKPTLISTLRHTQSSYMIRHVFLRASLLHDRVCHVLFTAPRSFAHTPFALPSSWCRECSLCHLMRLGSGARAARVPPVSTDRRCIRIRVSDGICFN